jgi:1-acyl-sn-glycerol-3-phosphate acyltransferase
MTVSAAESDRSAVPVPSHSQFGLLRERRFLPFFCTQFLGAFNDNVYKNALVILLAFHGAALTSMNPAMLVNVCAGLFILPFFLFSATAGQLADKYEKSRIIRLVKVFEILIMSVGAVGFLTQNLALLLVALFGMGAHSTMFGPVKYAILPQHLRPEELIGGNGLVESGTFVAILLGTIAGGLLIAVQPDGPLLVSVAAIVFAVLGYLVSRGVPHSPAPSPDLAVNWNPFSETARNLRFLRTNRTVFLSILGISWFWFYGAIFLSHFPSYSKDILGGDEHVVTLLLAIFSIGIGAGSLLCERLSGHKVEIGLVPFGSIGLTLFAVDLYFATPAAAPDAMQTVSAFVTAPAHWRLLADLLLIGIFGGFYIVPLYALIQTRSEKSHQSRVIAGNNILNAAFMVVAAVFAIVCLELGLTIPQLLLLTGILNACVAVYIYRLVPEFSMRFLAWLLVHSVYRLRARGLEHIPEEGPAVIVCNHPSFIDAVIVTAASRRPIRFVMDYGRSKAPLLKFIFREMRTIPIAPARENPEVLQQAYDEIARALEAGDLVGIFPEGSVSQDGELHPFRPGVRRILDRTAVPVVPMALRGLWGSFFSRLGGPGIKNPFRLGLFPRIDLEVAAPVAPGAATPEALHAQVLALRGDRK